MNVLYSLDGDILLWIQNNVRVSWMDGFFKTITHLGDAGLFWILLTVVLLCFKKTRKPAIYSAIALVGSVVITNMILKNAVGRIRPYEVVNGLQCIVKLANDPSFPSGHTSASFASATALCPKLPKPWAICLMVLAALIAFSRLYVGIHYPTDVLAGLVIGLALGILVNVIGDRVVKNMQEKKKNAE